ncbi:MAG: 50S ribosomal protein L11 methyltransferase [Deltaproteobacteria bacterium]|nr:50S ribosomal protein L11 methyltransferase [Deltaproteobacteria bacterium]
MTPAPPRELFIYEITGDARAAAQGPGPDLGPDYLGLWLEADSSFLFFGAPAGQRVASLLARDPALTLRDSYQMPFAAWQGGAGALAFSVGGLTIAPPWAEPPPTPGPASLVLDPGVVFGDGLHPTTRHCLELLDLLRRQGPLGRVSDLGCGTGILGLAALAWGAEEALAVDLNPLCVTTAAANAQANDLPLTVAEGPAGDFLARPARVALANLPLFVHAELWRPGPNLAGKEHLILSGIMPSEAPELTRLVTAAGFRLRERRETPGSWVALWASRRQEVEEDVGGRTLF